MYRPHIGNAVRTVAQQQQQQQQQQGQVQQRQQGVDSSRSTPVNPEESETLCGDILTAAFRLHKTQQDRTHNSSTEG